MKLSPSRGAPRPPKLRHFHRITYSTVPIPPEGPQLFRDRDAIACFELTGLLIPQGYQYGTTFHFYPDDGRALKRAFEPDDLLVLTTRPPMSDPEYVASQDKDTGDPAGKKRGKSARLYRSNTDLELAIFGALRRYVRLLSRGDIELTDEAVGLLDPKACTLRNKDLTPEYWRQLEVFVNGGGAEIQSHVHFPQRLPHGCDNPCTIAFFIRIAKLEQFGCGIIASFGMNGNGTLIWNRLVRSKFPWLVEGRGDRFVMAEIRFPRVKASRSGAAIEAPIPLKPLTPEFADDPEWVDARLLTRAP